MKTLWKSFRNWMLIMSMLALPSMHVFAEEDAAVESEEPIVFEPEVQSEVDAKTADEVGEKRREIIDEAVGAVAETREALKALERSYGKIHDREYFRSAKMTHTESYLSKMTRRTES